MKAHSTYNLERRQARRKNARRFTNDNTSALRNRPIGRIHGRNSQHADRVILRQEEIGGRLGAIRSRGDMRSQDQRA